MTGFNPRRLAVFTTVAALYIAPAINTWFTYLNNIAALGGMSKLNKALVMMLIDQTAGAVIINGGFFYAFSFADALFPPMKAEWNFVRSASSAIRSKFWGMLKTNWMSWCA